MGEVEIFKSEYWSKSKAFLLPLTGISNSNRYTVETYLFWDDYSIENYNLIVKFSHENYDEFIEYCRKYIFPIWDKSGYIVESYDFGKETVFVLDISEWALDIQMFLAGKYSKMSVDAKKAIKNYHIFYDRGEPQIEIEIAAILDPYKKYDILGDMNSIEYVADHYGLPLPELQKIGEVGSIYNKEKETLSYISAKVS